MNRIVLTEEEYLERLGFIIKRDFFPLLLAEGNESEAGGYSEVDGFSEVERLNLSNFQSKYTTEDDASFSELFARENERKRRKFERVFGASALLCDDPNRRLLLQETTSDQSKVKRPSITLKSTNTATAKINLQNTRFPSQKDSSGLRFKVPESPFREQLAHNLSATTSAKPVVKKKKASSTTTTTYDLEELKALTPKRKSK